MDIIFLTNIGLIVLFAFLKQTKENYIPFYSFGLFLGILTCVYLFCRYGMREQASTKAEIYFFASPFLLAFDIFLIYRQGKSSNGIGITTYLKNLLSEKTKTFIDRIFPAIIFYVFITTAMYSLVYFYEKAHPTAIPGDPNQWGFSLFHFIWQYLYIIPLTLMFWYMGLKKFSGTIIISSILYPFVVIFFVYSMALSVEN